MKVTKQEIEQLYADLGIIKESSMKPRTSINRGHMMGKLSSRNLVMKTRINTGESSSIKNPKN